MSKYIDLDDAVAIADYVADEHPYDKDPARPETYSDYNQGWNDACDSIRGKLETLPVTDGAPVRNGRWIQNYGLPNVKLCSACKTEREAKDCWWRYCPNCGAKMDL